MGHPAMGRDDPILQHCRARCQSALDSGCVHDPGHQLDGAVELDDQSPVGAQRLVVLGCGGDVHHHHGNAMNGDGQIHVVGQVLGHSLLSTLRRRSSWSLSITWTPSRIVVVRDSNRPRPLAIFQSAMTPEAPRLTNAITEAGSTLARGLHPCRVAGRQAKASPLVWTLEISL